jgi:pimeloyl-ACP methyl ester carboxylesterase
VLIISQPFRAYLPLIPAILATFMLTACAQVISGRAEFAHPTPAASIEWKPCIIDSLPRDAQCGELSVPINYAKPENGVAAIALIRFPATGHKIGSLLLNPGGPGGSGVGFAANALKVLPAPVRERFDVVGFDPRGVGESKPTIWCNSDADNDRERADPQVDYSPAGVAHIEQLNKEYVQRCVDKMGMQFLANVGTPNVVKDMDRLRAALGDDKLTFAGFSYGTELGSAYAEAFPQHVRALVLDGPVDPTADPMQTDISQMRAFQTAFNDFAADCAKSPDCPLGRDPAKSVDVFHSLVNPLVDKPASTRDPRGLSYPDAITGTISALYSQSFWDKLTAGLDALRHGAHADDLLALADQYWQRDDDGSYANLADANLAITCGDNPFPKDPQPWVEMDKRTREVAPFQSFGDFTGYAPRGVCAFWPVPPDMAPHTISAAGVSPALVIATTHDPATPYEAGVHLAEQLHGRLLTVDGTQHTAAFSGDECVDDIVAKYLVDLALPPPGAKC